MRFRDNIELMQYQKDGVEYAVLNKFTINAFDCGTGKTAVALKAACVVGRHTLIIAPAYLTFNWMKEIKKFTECKAWRFTYGEIIEPKVDIIVASYTELKHIPDLFVWADFVIADEFHYCKTPDSQRTSFLYNYMKQSIPDYFLGLTGTPIKNRIPEIYSLLCILGLGEGVTPNIQEDYSSYFTFCYHFTNPRQVKVGGRYITKFDGQRNVDELKKYLANRYTRVKAEDVLDLPEINEEELEVAYVENPKLKEDWESFKKGSLADSKGKAENAAKKAEFTGQYVETLLESGVRKVVVFTDHVSPTDIISKSLSKSAEVFIIHGGISMGDRSQAIESFEASTGCCILVATIGSSSTGINLVSCNHLVFNDLSWVPGDNEQALKRIHRIGQTKKCFITYIVGSGVDKAITTTLRSKERSIRKLI
jgi:SNF2 family DNA or RNA helicase